MAASGQRPLGDKKNIVVLGRTGNGKTSTIRTLLGDTEIKHTRSNGANNVLVYEGELGKEKVTLVECECIGDSVQDLNYPIETIVDSASDVFKPCENRIDAFVVVLKFGVRFTTQEQDAVRMVKCLFGDNVMRDFGVVVMTCGDNFDKEEEELSFDDWCGKQTGNIKALFEEINQRVVLVDNTLVRKHQINEVKNTKLIYIIEHFKDILSKLPNVYCENDFVKSESGRNELCGRENRLKLERQTREMLDKMDVDISRAVVQETFETLLKELSDYRDQYLSEDQDSDFIQQQLYAISLREKQITEKMASNVTTFKSFGLIVKTFFDKLLEN
ncbi:uncharacterized protein LOC131952093 [Physella acuta]|uniref:uncharacterized protein LOC131952093 n=1 Tax=Physella acuta TaxID=109671 RepID=UPI0027DDF509|nr:uncharacterized protein LOC131952093 [Physella acuta]